MLVVESRFRRLNALEAWWPEDARAAVELLPRAPVVTAMQCSAIVARGLERYAFWRRPFQTSLIDLALPEEELWARLHAKSCRYRISKARRLGIAMTVNEEHDAARRLIGEFLDRSGYRGSMSRGEWERYLAGSDVFTAKLDGQVVVAYVIRVDPPRRARILLSATINRDRESDRIIGMVNRYALWHQFGHYRRAGIRHFDLGGVTLDRDSPLYSITQFKLSFGGDIVEEHIVRLAVNPGLRIGLRGLATVRAFVRRDHRRAKGSDQNPVALTGSDDGRAD